MSGFIYLLLNFATRYEDLERALFAEAEVAKSCTILPALS